MSQIVEHTEINEHLEEIAENLIVEHLFYTISLATNHRTPGIFFCCDLLFGTVRLHVKAIFWTPQQQDGTHSSMVRTRISNASVPRVISHLWTVYAWSEGLLTHWGRDKMDAISQATCSSAFSWMKILEFRLKFHWSLFLRVQLTISQHWFR